MISGKPAHNFPLHTVIIYLTERCNLRCAYCYFRNKKSRDLPLSTAFAFLDRLGASFSSVPQRFEISGGEALLRWRDCQKMAIGIRQRFPSARIGLQTNGLLLTAEKIPFISKQGLAVEVGIDGDVGTTTRWRNRMTAQNFRKLVFNIRRCVEHGLALGCTMTVHPAEAGRITENYSFLRALGIRTVDITPAALTSWDKRSIVLFRKGYADLFQSNTACQNLYAGEDLQFLHESSFDLSLHPPGEVLCGDAFLCLPDELKARFSLWDRSKKGFRSEKAALLEGLFQQQRKKMKRQRFTYRDYVCLSFHIVNQLCGYEYVNVKEIVPLMNFMTRMNLQERFKKRGCGANGN